MDTDDETLLDEKARRTRDLLASFYSPIPSASSNNPFSKHASPDDINSSSFQPDQYMKIMVHAILVFYFSRLNAILVSFTMMNVSVISLR